MGAHLIDQALQLFGLPKSVFADIGFFRKNTQTNDYFELILFYENELRVRLKSSTMTKERGWECVIHGNNGSFLQQRFDTQEDELSKGTIPTMQNWLDEIKTPNGILNTTTFYEQTIAQNGNYMNFYQDLYDAIVFKKSNPVPAYQAVETMQVIDCAMESFLEKKIKKLELSK